MLGLGCMRLSTEGDRDEARALAVLEAALDAGVDLLDTSDAYAHDEHDIGHNERLISRVLAGRSVTVVTKGGLERPRGAWVPNGRVRHLEAAARASRERLGVEAIDLYLLHAVDPRVPLATSVRALAKLRDAGVVRGIGLSNVNAHQLEQALAITTIDAVEVELSPFKLDALRGGLVAACATRSIRVLAHRPLGGPMGAKRLERDAVVRELAGRVGATPAELVLSWLRRLSPSIVPIPGATRVETARSAARDVAIDYATQAALDARFLAVDAEPAKASVGGANATRMVGTSMAPDVVESAATGGGSSECGFSSSDFAGGAQREVVIIIGMQASGKSTIARDYAARGYLRLNRDELGGSLLKLARTLSKELRGGAERVVLDNTYGTRAQRAAVVEIARKHGAVIRCVVAATSIEQAQANAVTRMLERHGRLFEPHELGRDETLRPGVQFKFRREYEPPQLDEGFVAIEDVPFVARPREPSSIDRDHDQVVRAREAARPALIVELDDLVWKGRPRTPDAIVVADDVRGWLHSWSDAGFVIAATTWSPDGAVHEGLDDRLRELIGLPLPIGRCTHPAGPPVCWCRKPLPGLGLWLARAHSLELARSVHVGRGPADRGFAVRCGVRYLDVSSGFPSPDTPPSS